MQRLLAVKARAAANAAVEVPTENSEVAYVHAAGAVCDVAKIVIVGEHASVDQGVFRLAGRQEFASVVNDAGNGGRRDTGASDDEKSTRRTFEEVGIDNPYAQVGIGVKGKVWGSASRTHDPCDAILEVRAGFYGAGASTGNLPGVFEDEVAGRGVPGNRCATGSNYVWRRSGPDGSGGVPSRSDIHHTRRSEELCVKRRLRWQVELAAEVEAHGNLAAAASRDQVTRQNNGLEKIAALGGSRLDEKDSRAGRHGVSVFDVQRLFQFPSAAGIQAGLRAGGIDNREVGGGKSEYL